MDSQPDPFCDWSELKKGRQKRGDHRVTETNLLTVEISFNGPRGQGTGLANDQKKTTGEHRGKGGMTVTRESGRGQESRLAILRLLQTERNLSSNGVYKGVRFLTGN